MDMESVQLVANPGSGSRKYALYNTAGVIRSYHVEYENGAIICTIHENNDLEVIRTDLTDLHEAIGFVSGHLSESAPDLYKSIERIGIRVVAPGSFFLQNRQMDRSAHEALAGLEPLAPLHVGPTLRELDYIYEAFPDRPVIGVSDSAFHITKPDFAWNYAIPLQIADEHDIKRFGFHGISMTSVVRQLRSHDFLPQRVVACHLGSGASITALMNGASQDNTMGYTPMEGLMMATRTGNIDAAAAIALKQQLHIDDNELRRMLNSDGGFLGISGHSSDLRELLLQEQQNNYRAKLAIAMYAYKVQLFIGQMAAALGGIDALVFTGTVGERSSIIRNRICSKLGYLGFNINPQRNDVTVDANKVSAIQTEHSKPIYVVPCDEAHEIAYQTRIFSRPS